jgi:SAM-dependent methyltransferase
VKRCLRCGGRFDGDWPCPACGAAPETRGGFTAFAPELADGDGHDADYDYDVLAEVEDTHFWFRSRAQLLAWAIARYFRGAQSMLEIGCGTGGVARVIRARFPAMRLAATEVLVRGLDFARGRLPGVQLLQMDAHRIPFDAEFDLVGAFDVIEHIDDDEAVLRGMRDAVRPGGGVLITVPQHPFLWSAIDDYSHHRRRYTRRELARKIERAGLRIVRLTSFVSLLLPLLLLSRRSRRPFDPAREMRVRSGANRMLLAISRIEQSIVASGVSLPAGGSLLAIAQRVD